MDTALTFLLETVRDLLVEEVSLWRGVSGEVEQVERALRSIHASLMKADREKRDSPTLKDCIFQLRNLASRAENVLERYAVKVESKKEGRSFKDKFQRYICILSERPSVHEISEEAPKIMSLVENLRTKLESEFGQQSSHEDERQRQRLLRLTHPHVVEPYFVETEEDIEELVSMVKEEDSRLSRVVVMYGMGGLGKTTLARKIYNRADFASYARAWVCITQQMQPLAALTTILKCLDRNAETDQMDVPRLVGRIHQFLKEKECLIVIDDIWENKDWEIIRPAFPHNCNVLITTRNKSIGNHECRPYELRLLTEDQGWDLLQKKALALVDTQPDGTILKSFEVIGRQIVKKCGYLPLYISLMGGILRQEEVQLVEWRKINTKVDSYLRNGGDGAPEEDRIEEVLGLSYDSLPYYLKPCFLYLACLREDEEIDIEILYLLWMAEGLVSHQHIVGNESLRDVAQRYLTELVIRCMVQVVVGKEYPWDSSVHSSCRLHDLMHSLCTSKAEAEKFLERVDLHTRNIDGIPSRFSTSTYRLATPSSIGNSSSRIVITLDYNTRILSIEELEKVKKLRCLIFRPRIFLSFVGFEHSTIDLGKSPCLRILDLKGCQFKDRKLPRKVRKLIHLRYLSLRDTNVRKLPELCMPYLHTLDLRIHYKYKIKVANVIWKMRKLRHLFLYDSMIELIGGEKVRLDGLLELETLDEISSEIACVADIPKLINLRKLGIRVCDVDSMTVVAHHMRNGNNRLCETNLYVWPMYGIFDLNSEIGGDAIKNVLMSPSLVDLRFIDCNVGDGFPYYEEGMCMNLVYLVLYKCEVGGDVMEKLGRYPVLQSLFLLSVDFGTETLIFPSNTFLQLKSLVMFILYNVRELQVEETAMPKLKDVHINNMHLGTVAFEIPREFVDRVRGQGGTVNGSRLI